MVRVTPRAGDRVLALRLHREANHGHHRYVPATVVDVAPDWTGRMLVQVRYDEGFHNGWGTCTFEARLHPSRIRPG